MTPHRNLVRTLKQMAAVLALAVICSTVIAACGDSPASAALHPFPSCYVVILTQTGEYRGDVDANFHTSCPFAQNVARASLRRIIQFGGRYNGPLTTTAYSPVTGLWYRVDCNAYGDLFHIGMDVTCHAGKGAAISYRAHGEWSTEGSGI